MTVIAPIAVGLVTIRRKIAQVVHNSKYAGAGNNPMVGMTVSVAVAVEEALK